MSQKHYKVIGLMSGTSLDGLDIAYCEFYKENDKWSFELKNSVTIEYPKKLEKRLKNAQSLSDEELDQLDIELGEYYGNLTKTFIEQHQLTPTLVASHGHTIFHEPDKGITLQIGCGKRIYAITGIQTVADFRSMDVSLGGQGAPLVPIGDQLLFSEYDYCINLGGFANISFGSPRTAFDICPTNFVLNHYVSLKTEKSFDANGELAQSGSLNQELLNKLNNLEFYQTAPPKSLGREWVETHIFPIIDDMNIPLEDILHTFCHHAAEQIGNVIEKGAVLFSGGGVYNSFLMKCIAEKLSGRAKIIILDNNTTNYKEALVFAFLGVLRLEEIPNCLKSVTGASRDNIGGVLFG